jgi:hypothetical protein
MVNNNRFMIAFSSCLGIKNTGFQERMRNLTNMQYQRRFPPANDDHAVRYDGADNLDAP